jgi:recombination protein RecA
MTAKSFSIARNMVAAMRKKEMEVSLLSDDTSPCTVSSFVSTGCVALDVIMGGGLPVGRMTEMFGDPSSGKSLIAAQMAAVTQEDGGIVAYADTETAVSKAMMHKVGVNVDELIYASPDTVDEVFKFFDYALELKMKMAPEAFLLMIWDSVAATSSSAEMDKDYGDVGYLTHARVISQALRKITRKISKEKTGMLFLNQTRDKLGVMFGEKTATFGGKAISFHASVRVQLSLANKLKVIDGKRKRIVGMNTRAVVVKNKVAAPFKETILPIYFGDGIDDPLASYLWLKDNGFITTSGSSQTLELPEYEPIKFSKNAWNGIYDSSFDAIAETMMATIEDDFASNEVEEDAPDN